MRVFSPSTLIVFSMLVGSIVYPSISLSQTQDAKPNASDGGEQSGNSATQALSKSLKDILTGMGLSPDGPKDGSIEFKDKENDYVAYPSDDGDSIILQNWWDIPKAKVQSIPYVKLLDWNDGNKAYFSTSTEKSGDVTINLQVYLDVKNLDAAVLRKKLDILEDAVNDNVDLLDITKWK